MYENEGHGYHRTDQFLAKHLGGRAEPVGDIKGHSGEIK